MDDPQDSLDQKGEVTALSISVKGYALLTFLTVDLFGYVFCGMALLVVLQVIFDFYGTLGLAGEASELGVITQLLVALIIVGCSYVVGLAAEILGSFVASIVPGMRIHLMYSRAHHDIVKRRPELADHFSLSGLKVVEREKQRFFSDVFFPKGKDDALFVFRQIGGQWIYLRRPDLYFLVIGRRDSASRIAEALLGITLICIGISLAELPMSIIMSVNWWGSVAFVLTIALITLYRVRANSVEAHINTVITLWLEEKNHPSVGRIIT